MYVIQTCISPATIFRTSPYHVLGKKSYARVSVRSNPIAVKKKYVRNTDFFDDRFFMKARVAFRTIRTTTNTLVK